jgi:hypothetical protein
MEIGEALQKLEQTILESSIVRHIPMEFYLGNFS